MSLTRFCVRNNQCNIFFLKAILTGGFFIKAIGEMRAWRWIVFFRSIGFLNVHRFHLLSPQLHTAPKALDNASAKAKQRTPHKIFWPLAHKKLSIETRE